MSDVTTQERILAYGHKAVRQGNKATRSPGKRAPASARSKGLPTHVRFARKVWKKHFEAQKYGAKVVITDLAQAPDKGLRTSPFAAWTNSPTDIFVKDFPGADAAFWTAVLYHERLHVVQFIEQGKGKPPQTYEQMMEYEREAYGDSAVWAKKDVPPGVSVHASGFKQSAAGYIAELDRVRALPPGTDAEKEYKAYLEKEGLPKVARVADLYTAP